MHHLRRDEIQRYLSNNENHLHIVKTTEVQVLIPVVLLNSTEHFGETTNPCGESSLNNRCKRPLNNIEDVSNMQVRNLARIASLNFINLASEC